MLYQSTCVGFGYGLMWELFPGTPSQPEKSNKLRQHTVIRHYPLAHEY